MTAGRRVAACSRVIARADDFGSPRSYATPAIQFTHTPRREGGTVKTVPCVPEAGLEIAGQARNDGNRRAFGGRTQFAPTGTPEWLWRGESGHYATVGHDAFAVLPPAKPALRAASRSEVQDIAPRYEGGTVKTVPCNRRDGTLAVCHSGANWRFAPLSRSESA